MSELCIADGCTMMGVFPGERTTEEGETLIGMLCFGHSEGDEVVAIEPAQLGGFHIDVVNGLAAMLLEHTAMSMVGTEDATGDAMRSLAANTEWTEDVAAGVLLALSYIAAAGQVGDDELLHGSEVFERLAAQETDDETPPEAFPHPKDDAGKVHEFMTEFVAEAFPHPPEDEAGDDNCCPPCVDERHVYCEDPHDWRHPAMSGEDDTPVILVCCCGIDLRQETEAPQDPLVQPDEGNTEQTEGNHDGQHEHESTAGG